MRPKKRPTSFEVNGMEWAIEYRSARSCIELVDALGYCNPDTNTILLRMDLEDRVLWPTLAHEVLHAVDWSTGVRRALEHVKPEPLAISELYADGVAWAFLRAWESLK